MPNRPGHASLSGALVERGEIISKTMIRALSYTPLAEEGVGAYPVSRTDRGVSWDRRGRSLTGWEHPRGDLSEAF
jgi:hypothetical protein